MKSNYALLIRFSLGITLVVLGLNQFFHFLNFTGALQVLLTNKMFYGFLFLISGVAILFGKAMPVALIILSFFAVQAFFYFLANNPKNLISPIGIIVLLVILNIADNKDRFKGLFY